MPIIDYTYQGVHLTNFYAYEGWFLITNPDTIQYRLRAEAGENYDAEGFAKIGERYVIACAAPEDGGLFGNVGDYIDWTMPDGSILKTIVGETKDPGDAEWIPLGHLDETDHTRVNVIEFLVSRDWYYPTLHENPGTPTCHPEWAGQIRAFEHRGNYWGVRYPSGQDGAGGVVGRTSPITYISPSGADMLQVHFQGQNPLLFYRANTIWLPRESVSLPTVNTPQTPTGNWARANEALQWCVDNRGLWPYNQNFHDGSGLWRGLGLTRGDGCDCSGFVSKMLYHFAPAVFADAFGSRLTCPDTYELWLAFEKVWDSANAIDPDTPPADLRPGDIALFASGWLPGQAFPPSYTVQTKRHVFIYMADGTFWDQVKDNGPDNTEWGIYQTPQAVWDARGHVNASRWCVVRPNYGGQ